MPNLKGKKILLGITGGIAAYKSILLLRSLRTAGAEVQVMLTPDAHEFVTPLTLSALSDKPVLTDLFDDKTGVWNNHVALAEWADLMVIAPLTANSLSKMAHGLCDNLLLCCYYSARCSVVVAPAMDLEMYQHITVQENMKKLLSQGVTVIEPAEGYLASGLIGKGRMEEPETILSVIESKFEMPSKDLRGKRILVNAGPTREYIDPVRYISNESSGKMGIAIASELAVRGALVELVLGPVTEPLPALPLNIHRVVSAEEMADQCELLFPDCDAAILSAAVADFRPESKQLSKIKKNPEVEDQQLRLIKNRDILQTLGASKREDQVLIGFALETDNELVNAREKLTRKKADLIVLNTLNDPGAGFGLDTNKITLVEKLTEQSFPLQTKKEVAVVIADKLVTLLTR